MFLNKLLVLKDDNIKFDLRISNQQDKHDLNFIFYIELILKYGAIHSHL
jgi:hypothetical protein